MKPQRPIPRGFLTLSIVLALAAASCSSSSASLVRVLPPGYKAVSGNPAVFNVSAIAAVYDATKDRFFAFAPLQSVQGDADVVVWVAITPPGASATIRAITWSVTNPFPKLTCGGDRFCYSISPSSAPNGTYPYSATILYNGKTYSLDPSVEIWRP